jgi:hypothetical protein
MKPSTSGINTPCGGENLLPVKRNPQAIRKKPLSRGLNLPSNRFNYSGRGLNSFTRRQNYSLGVFNPPVGGQNYFLGEIILLAWGLIPLRGRQNYFAGEVILHA